MKLLHIDASILSDQSVSRQLTAAIANQLRSATADTTIIYHDLVADPIGHLSIQEHLAPRGVDPQDQSAKQNVARNTVLLDEFLNADVIIIGAPMYNFSLPSQLKAWLDRLAVAGKTFSYTATGVQGLVQGKRVIIASTRGGLYSEGSPAAFLDHQETYLRGFFGFLGVSDVTFIRAEGLAGSPENRTTVIDQAITKIEQLAA